MSRSSQKINVNNLLYSKNIKEINEVLLSGQISSTDIRNDREESCLHTLVYSSTFEGNNKKMYNILLYLLTCVNPPNIDGLNIWNESPALICARFNKLEYMNALINFSANRSIKSNRNSSNPVSTALNVSIKRHYLNNKFFDESIKLKYNCTEVIKLLKKYYPSEEEKLNYQLKCKETVDSIFDTDIGYPRFDKEKVDLKYQSIEAVKTGDLNLLIQSLLYVDTNMAISLTIVAIEREHYHLLNCLIEKLTFEKAFNLRYDKSVEPLIYIGINANPINVSNYLINTCEFIDINIRARILSLFKIFYHKYIYLDVNTIFELVQILLDEFLLE
jgi:hypothetical protein